jgi:prepilin-type N-terminal cleavage/methylation domain-containing protein
MRRRAFTLIELLLVITIIAILFGLSLVVFPKAFQRVKTLNANVSEGQTNMLKMIDSE